MKIDRDQCRIDLEATLSEIDEIATITSDIEKIVESPPQEIGKPSPVVGAPKPIKSLGTIAGAEAEAEPPLREKIVQYEAFQAPPKTPKPLGPPTPPTSPL